MFVLTKNDFLNSSKCWYKDEYENTAYFRKEESKIVGKLRFSNPNISVEPLEINFPIKEDDMNGVELKYKTGGDDYLNHTTDDLTSFHGGLSGFTELVKRWIGIYYAVQTFVVSNSIYANEDTSEEDIIAKKFMLLSQYDELLPLVDQILKE